MTTDKDLLQDKMVNTLFSKNNLILMWGTGVGKSLVAIRAMFRGFEYVKSPKYLLVVAETSHKDNWKNEFVKFLGKESAEMVLEHTTVICYASLKNYRNTSWDIVCFDEAHHLGSDLRMDILQTITAKKVLALSATLKEDVIDALNQSFDRFIINRLNVQESIDKGFLPEPKIVCISLELERFKRTETIEMDLRTAKSKDKGTIKDLWSNRWKYLKNRKSYAGYVLQFSCTQKEKYDYINEQFEYWKNQYFRNQGNIRLKNMWLQWGTKRKRFLGDLKTQEAYSLCKKLKKQKKRFICFCSSIVQAEALGGNNCIHSKKKDSAKIISEFNSKVRDSIFAVGMLVEGVSLTDIQAGIIVQLDGEERQFIQKSGRVYRAKDPIQYIFYYRGTRDEEYLQKALEGINKDYIMEV